MEMESGDIVIGLATTTAHTKKLPYNVVLGYVSLTILLACMFSQKTNDNCYFSTQCLTI